MKHKQYTAKIAVLVMTALIITDASFARKPSPVFWEEIPGTTDLYSAIDLKSIRATTNNNIFTLNIVNNGALTILGADNTNYSFESVLMNLKIDCKKQQLGIIDLHGYSQPFAQGNLVIQIPTQNNMEPKENLATDLRYVMDRVCSQ